MTPGELAAELDAGTVRPAYLLAGEEALLRDDALAAIERAVLTDASRDFNHDRLAGDATSPAALQDALAALPVMAARRLVVLRDPDGRRAGAKALLDALGDLVAAQLAQAESVLVVVCEKPDKRQRWVKAFGKAPAAIVACDAPRTAREIAAFAKAEAKRQGVALDAGAAERLAELVGPVLLLLRQEIAKAALLVEPGAKVTAAIVEASTSQLAEQPIWDLTDAIGEGRTADALRLLGRMADVAPPAVLGALASHFRKLARVRHGARVAGPPFVARKLEGQARRFTHARIGACLEAIHAADVALKGGSALAPALALERLVLGLAS
ncbi:MAG: DNA polymerase III subunit delta [Myxococcota bacterium]|nr:DNA polymerase III subunit delta [Myxococcales bacterium]